MYASEKGTFHVSMCDSSGNVNELETMSGSQVFGFVAVRTDSEEQAGAVIAELEKTGDAEYKFTRPIDDTQNVTIKLVALAEQRF